MTERNDTGRLERIRRLARRADKKLSRWFRLSGGKATGQPAGELPAPPSEGDKESTWGAIGLTCLARRGKSDAAARQELAERLHPYLPALAEEVGLVGVNLESLRQHLVHRATTGLGEGRFRDMLVPWLQEFARDLGLALTKTVLTDADLNRVIERSQIRTVLADTARMSEATWFGAFCEQLRERDMLMLQNLRGSQLPEELGAVPEACTLFPDYLSELVVTIKRRCIDGHKLFEVSHN